MSSILTNNAAMSALSNLSATQKSLNTTENQISSGLRVANASDNAAYWSIATTMRGDTGALSAVSDALNLGSSVVGVASSALNSTITIMQKMQQDLVAAQTPGTDISKVQTDIASLQQSLKSIANSASFNGVNLLSGTSTTTSSTTGTGTAAVTTYATTASTENIVASFSRSSAGIATVGTIGINTATTMLIDSNATTGAVNSGILSKAGAALSALAAAGTPDTSANGTTSGGISNESILGFQLTASTSSAALQALSTDIATALSSITQSASSLGATQTNITNQSTFVSALSDAITSGVGSLVDADMNVASTKLQALQTQQQLGIQSLSIANQNSQLILKLFGG